MTVPLRASDPINVNVALGERSYAFSLAAASWLCWAR
jgi:hypothetical protein